MRKLSLFALVAMMMVLVPSALGQEEPKCASELDACGPFINSTTAKPPRECCTPLRSVLNDEVPCICSIFKSRELIQSLSINVTEAVTLPKRCGIDFDLLAACEALPMTPAVAPAPAKHKRPHKLPHARPPKHSHSPSPAMSPAGSLAPGPSTGNASSKIASIGSLLGSFLLVATLMLH